MTDFGRSKNLGSKHGLKLFNQLILLGLKFYRKVISPLLPQACRFEPSCSRYAIACFERFGFFRAVVLTTKRLSRCHPFCEGGIDPAPMD